MNNFEDQLTQFTETIMNGVKDSIANAANAIAEEAKQNATGDIADSISIETGDDGLSATISVNSPNAAAAEYGIEAGNAKPHEARKAKHGKKKGKEEDKHDKPNTPKPFLNPAFESQVPVFISKLQDLISN